MVLQVSGENSPRVLVILVAAAALIACGYPPSYGHDGHSGSGLDIDSAITNSSDGGSIFLHMDCRDYYVVVLLCIAVGASGFPMAGFNVNHLDIAPQYAGVLMGITNTAATIPGFVAPALTGHCERRRLFYTLTLPRR